MEKNKYRTLWQILILCVASFITLLLDRLQTGDWRKPTIVLVTIIVISGIPFLLLHEYGKFLSKSRIKKSGLGTAFRFFSSKKNLAWSPMGFFSPQTKHPEYLAISFMLGKVAATAAVVKITDQHKSSNIKARPSSRLPGCMICISI